MVRLKCIFNIFFVLALLFGTRSFAQELPKMPEDTGIQMGVLPNGTNYYVVANPGTKGLADFALVQKSGKGFSNKVKTTEISESLLTRLPNLDGLSPRKFFMDYDVVPKEGRFISVQDGKAVFRFSNVVLKDRPQMLDSTLLVLMSMIHSMRDYEDSFVRSCYAPSENAIIISGDVKTDEVIEKIKMLSYMTPNYAAVQRNEYVWREKDAKYISIKSSGRTAIIKAAWKLPATPPQFVGTIQPAVHSKLILELGDIASNRIVRALASKGIASTSAKYSHKPSSQTGGDEDFEVSIVVEDKCALEALAIVAEVLSSISSEGVSIAERKFAHGRFMRKSFEKSVLPVRSDKEYVDICINAFLHGDIPVPATQLYEFYSSKDVSDSVETLALNRLASAVLRVDKNMIVKCISSTEIEQDSLKSLFVNAWKRQSTLSPAAEIIVSDTLKKLSHTKKMPMLLSKKEHMSGGYIWNFANGLKVIYKRMDTCGKFYWGMGLNGGYADIKNLSVGEGAFVGDMMTMSKISGMLWKDYVNYLEQQGLYIDVAVSLFSTTLKGVAQVDGLPLLFRTLQAITTEREFDKDAFEAYKREQWLHLERTAKSSKVVIDSLMCPGYKYSGIKTSGKLSNSLIDKSETLFKDVFSKLNDGVIVIIGDQEESLVRKQIQGYLSKLPTTKLTSVRPSISYKITSGAMTHTAEGRRNAIYLAMSVPFAVTTQNNAISHVAGMLLQNSLTSALVGTGLYANVYYNTSVTPQDLFNVMIVLEQVPGVERKDAVEVARKVVRSVLDPNVGIAEITDAQVEGCKEWLKHNHSCRMQSPQYWVDAILRRYLDGRDFTSGYDAQMDGVTSEAVRALLASLKGAGKVEYIIKKK